MKNHRMVELKMPDGSTVKYDPKHVKVYGQSELKVNVLCFISKMKYAFWRVAPKYLFYTDPCKKCLVQACCSDELSCKQYRHMLEFKGNFASLTLAKAYLWTIYGGTALLITMVIFC